MENLLTPKQAGQLIGKNAGFMRANYREFGGFILGKRKYFTKGGISHALQNAKRPMDGESDHQRAEVAPPLQLTQRGQGMGRITAKSGTSDPHGIIA
jgi:hypothetical protein